ncbi:DUF5689 domain-containing protein [Aureispira anguillae]|uniref:DUF5689 domain-containing protein n=1 Tax=Aureispira anguillae TaxID=2864201 RepID=A0A916DSG8_9BACT|nr:DUF5689 domain-containing protein [Aureispira anguillae]BDS11871.1 DUF5689 domain-containing protein [Aureispira anguillae]
MKARYFNFSSFLLLVTLMVFSACKKQFDEPPISELPNLEANTTIADVIAMASPSPVALGNQILEATVIADDKSGNFYKQIVIQDSTGGIRIDIDAYSIYNDFPIGRKVWVKCEGLYIWQDGDVPALIGSSNTNDSRLPQSTYRQFIIGGEYNQPLTPTVKTLSTLTSADYHTLVQLDNVEFADCFAGGTYAYASTQTSKNADLTECATGGTVIVRNSGFANYANELMPTGNGSIIAVYNSFSGTAQLFIRDPRDVSSMTGTRCVSLANYTDVSIQALRGQFSGAPTSATGKIKGIVISDGTSGQWQGRNMVIQEPNGAGITVRFDDDHGFAVGDYVEVKVGGATLEEYNNLLQVNNLPLCRATALPNPGGISITPRVATVADVIANVNDWESTLINVQAANINGAVTYGDFNVMLNDATGSVTMFSRFANFASTPLPTGTGDVTAVIGDHTSGPQLLIRNLSDVNITGSGGGGGGTNLNQISIQDARNLFTGASTTAPDTTKIIGIVISDRVGGNWQDQNVVIQEINGSGITVRFAGPHTFNLGDELEVNISQQTIEEFNGLLQVNGVPNANATALSSGNVIAPRVATIADIMANPSWESTLINVQTATLSGGSTYGDFNVMLNDATGSISMFSAFSNFASTALPTGSGDVTGVVGDYNGTQINIRNTSDVNFTGGGGGSTNFITIGAARALFSGSATNAPANTSIAGIVISDKDNGNITAKNLVLQQTGGAGVVVRFTSDNTTISEGDSITVDISGADISEYNGLLQISNVANANAVVISTGNTMTPRVATIQDILTNAEAWESTLVKINGATISGATTYSGTTTVTDATGNMDMYTRSGATFSGSNVAIGTVSITAIVSQFTGYQINIRNTTDVQ